MPPDEPVAGGPVLTALVLSDIHAYSDDVLPTSQNAPSWVRASAHPIDARYDALVGLTALIEAEEIKTDYVICCGDIVDKAVPTALSYVWARLGEIQALTGARGLIITSGNHDVDSRHNHNAFDAKGELQALSPTYPHPDEAIADRYWSKHFYVVEEADYRIVVLNSAAYHGEAEEWAHGRVSDRTLERLRQSVVGHRSLNTLVIHHHLVDNPDIDREDYSVLRNNERVLAFVAGADAGPWLIVHGHKHYPRLTYGAHGGVAIFSAGSLGAKLYPELAQRARNQVYEVSLQLDSAAALGLDIAGRFRSWDFAYGIGWQPASEASGLPARGGFGFRDALASLGASVVAQFPDGVYKQTWEDLCVAVPKLRFLSPEDMARLRVELGRLGFQLIDADSRFTITEVLRDG